MAKLHDARVSARIFRSIVGTLLGVSIPTAAIMCGGSTDGQTCAAPPDAASLNCSSVYTVKGCAAELSEGGTSCFTICGNGGSCRVVGNDVECTVICAIDGRRPPGIEGEEQTEARTLGEHFARTAFYERASADAFEVLARELREHGAPDALVRSARRARKDEIDHARRARRLAGRASVRKTHAPAKTTRTLFEIALDNAKEGCARETFGALLGWAQARRAEDASARRFYARIAKDETRHASLSWRLHAWLLERLSDAEKKAVLEALDASLAGVAAAHSPFDRTLGVPDAATCRALASALRRALPQA